MEPIRRGPVSLVYFTVRRDDFANLHPHPPFQYFLVTQVFTADGETSAPSCSESTYER